MDHCQHLVKDYPNSRVWYYTIYTAFGKAKKS